MIVVPYVPGRLRAQTKQWASEHGAQLYELSFADDAYWTALVQWWRTPGDLVVVEQDIVPHAGVVEAMLACPRMWCSSPYQIGGTLWIDGGLGCTKFSDQLKHQLPDVMIQAGEPRGESEPPRAWWQTDARLSGLLRQNGVTPHAHERSVHLARTAPGNSPIS